MRKFGQVLEPVLGEACSAQTISRITRQRDQAVAQFHRRALCDDTSICSSTGWVLKVRDLTAKVRRRCVLVAYGVLPNGKREMIWIAHPPFLLPKSTFAPLMTVHQPFCPTIVFKLSTIKFCNPFLLTTIQIATSRRVPHLRLT